MVISKEDKQCHRDSCCGQKKKRRTRFSWCFKEKSRMHNNIIMGDYIYIPRWLLETPSLWFIFYGNYTEWTLFRISEKTLSGVINILNNASKPTRLLTSEQNYWRLLDSSVNPTEHTVLGQPMIWFLDIFQRSRMLGSPLLADNIRKPTPCPIIHGVIHRRVSKRTFSVPSPK